MSKSELRRLNLIGSATRRREYLLSRSLIRHALNENFECPKSDWIISEVPGSPPVIENLPRQYYFSLSHSKSCIVFAMSNCPVGVDIEFMSRQRNFERLAEMFMNPAELDILRSDSVAQTEYFYRLWSAKEAYYKSLLPVEQAPVSLSDIAHADLTKGKVNRQLVEALSSEFSFATVTKSRPDSISCQSYLSDKNPLPKEIGSKLQH